MNAAPCLTWIKRGAAKPKPDRLKLSDKQLSKLVRAGAGIDEDDDDEDDEASGVSTENNSAADVTPAPESSGSRKTQARVEAGGEGSEGARDRVIDEYGLDDYDEEEDGDVASRAISMAGLSYYGNY